jgi:hypothetical protein
MSDPQVEAILAGRRLARAWLAENNATFVISRPLGRAIADAIIERGVDAAAKGIGELAKPLLEKYGPPIDPSLSPGWLAKRKPDPERNPNWGASDERGKPRRFSP